MPKLQKINILASTLTTIGLVAFALFKFGFIVLEPQQKLDLTGELIQMDTTGTAMNPAVSKKIERFFRHKHRSGFSGAVLYADRGKIVYKNTFGYGDYRKKNPIELDDPFQLASVSKPITALAIQQLQEKGLLQYDDPIQKFIPEFPYKGINVRQLLIHKSGLPNYMYFPKSLWPDNEVATNEDMICLMATHEPPIYLLPNKKYNYSNTGYGILASIIERTSGMSYEDYMEKHIFEPVGMTNSFVYNKSKSPELPPDVIGYQRKRRRMVRARNLNVNGVVGDKGIYSTVDDLFKLDQVLYTNELINQNNLRLAFSPAHERLYAHDNYGLGWRINTDHLGNRIAYHTGWWRGFRTYFIRELYSQRTIIVLSNNAYKGFIGTNELRSLFHVNEGP